MAWFNTLFGGGGEEEAERASKLYGDIAAPSAEELMYTLQEAVYRGDITPQQAEIIMQDPSLMSQVTSGAGIGAQAQALAGLRDITQEGEMPLADRAAMNQMLGQIGAQTRGAREAVMQRAAERGVAGGGMELVNQLLAEQAGATEASQRGLDIAAQSQQAKANALQQMASIGSGLESQQFGEAAQRAQAQDAINRFNAANRQATINANIAAANEAALRNVSERQRISDVNTQIKNLQAAIPAQARMQQFEAQMAKAGGQAGALGNLAQVASASRGQDVGFLSSLLGVGGGIASAYAPTRQQEAVPSLAKKYKTSTGEAAV